MRVSKDVGLQADSGEENLCVPHLHARTLRFVTLMICHTRKKVDIRTTDQLLIRSVPSWRKLIFQNLTHMSVSTLPARLKFFSSSSTLSPKGVFHCLGILVAVRSTCCFSSTKKSVNDE